MPVGESISRQPAIAHPKDYAEDAEAYAALRRAKETKMKRGTKYALGTAAGIGAAGLVGGAAALAVLGLGIRSLLARPVPEGAVVVITGGSRGLGYAIASRLARKKVKLVLAARDREELEKAQQRLIAEHPHMQPADFYLAAADLSDRSACERVVDDAFAHFGRIDMLVNNAGIIQVGPVECQSVETFEYALKIMYQAALYTTMAALPRLLEQSPAQGWSRRAAIVNIASIGGKVAVPHLLPYVGAKFALVGFSEGLHAELKHKGIHVMTVCPGLMRTGGEVHAEYVGQREKEAAWFRMGATTPGLSTSASHAAAKIVRSLADGRAEITITPQAWLAARVAGTSPELTQFIAAQANRWILPAAPAMVEPSPETMEGTLVEAAG
jgi:short-subunit dehydrogenase